MFFLSSSLWLLCIFFLQRHKCYFAFSILAIHIGGCIALEPPYVTTCSDANTNTARVQYAIGFWSEIFCSVIHDWNLFGCVIIHSQASLVLAQFQVFPFYSSFDSVFFFSAFVFFSFFRFHFWHFNCCPVQRARSNATISIHLFYTYPSFSHSSNEPSSIHLFKPTICSCFRCKMRARRREQKREKENGRRMRLDPSLLQSFIMHQLSKINHRKAEIRWNALRMSIAFGRLCKYIVMVLEKPSKALADQPYRQHLVRVSNKNKNANHNVYHSRIVHLSLSLFLSLHGTRLLSHMHCIYAFSVKCINGLFRW